MAGSSARSDAGKGKTTTKWLLKALIPVLILAGTGTRLAGLGFRSLDMRDYLIPWYNEFAKHGCEAFRYPFSNYTPPYLYLLYLMTKISIPRIAAIKLIAICFDFLNAFLIYKILKMRYPQGDLAAIGAGAFLLLPTVFLNSAYWGQADAIYTFFLLLCIIFLMRDQPFLAMIFWGLSFSFKAQAAFLGPLILLLIVRKKIPWYYLGMIPLVYMMMMMPAVLIGRPIIELLTIYFSQANTYHMLSMNAPNIYLVIPSISYNSGLIIGIATAILVALTWTAIYAIKIKEFTPQTILLCGLVAVAFMPFFLPKMHDRYFYLAEVFSFLVAFYIPRLWWTALGYQVVSGLVYFVFLHSSLSVTRVQTPQDISILVSAAIINMILLGLVFWNQWRVQMIE